MRLIHPIYLDVPMLVSFAAAMQGGLAFDSDITKERASDAISTHKTSGGFGISNLFGSLFGISLSADIAGSEADRSHEVSRESKSHTEASIAIILYDQLCKQDGHLIQPKDIADFEALEPGSLVEVAGTLEKNAVDTVIDYMNAVEILGGLGSAADTPKKGATKNNPHTPTPIGKLRETLDKDRKRTPISNVLLRCSEPEGTNVVITLRTANLRDLTLSELHKNSVRVVGKVTRVIQKGQSMSAFENYGMALIDAQTLRGLFSTISSSEGMNAQFSEVELEGPAIQILPLMVFV